MHRDRTQEAVIFKRFPNDPKMHPGMGTTKINSCVSFLQREVGGWPWAGHLHCSAHVGHLRISQVLTHGSECAWDCASRKAPWLMATPGLSGTRWSERSGNNLIKILSVPTLQMTQSHEFLMACKRTLVCGHKLIQNCIRKAKHQKQSKLRDGHSGEFRVQSLPEAPKRGQRSSWKHTPCLQKVHLIGDNGKKKKK